MKQLIKKILLKLRLYDFFVTYYHMKKQWQPGYFKAEMNYRFKGGPDGYPLPPSPLMHKVIARGWAKEFLDLGKEEVDDMTSYLDKCGINVADFTSILDFGCGCGRLIRHYLQRTDARLYGTDYNPKLVKWCQKKLKFGEFGINSFLPPLEYQDQQFDYIYMYSVFTHMGEEAIKTWMQELYRILKAGGVFLFTAHGEKYPSFLSEQQWHSLEEGKLITLERAEEGSNYYGSFFFPRWVKENILDGFELLGHFPGKHDLRQDTYVIRKL